MLFQDWDVYFPFLLGISVHVNHLLTSVVIGDLAVGVCDMT